ncbi:MAG: hypothetical protein ACXQS5_01395 [Candidatus Methanospirareceae archaeon]|nr:hypothetical protein [Methanosarcinales archaeon]
MKTGAYRPADLARAIKFASKAKIDLLTVDADRLAEKGEFVPNIAAAGGGGGRQTGGEAENRNR